MNQARQRGGNGASAGGDPSAASVMTGNSVLDSLSQHGLTRRPVRHSRGY
jgi:hypothetical protein